MEHIKTQIILLAATSLFTCECNASSHYVVVEEHVGEAHVFTVDPKEPFGDVIMNISKHLSEESNGIGSDPTSQVQMQVLPENYNIIMHLAKKPRSTARSYAAGVTAGEAGDITYIVKTLSNSTLPKIKSAESSLKKAGDRIDHVHPLQFLLCVFTREELKVAVRNLEGRTWVWTDFLKGLTDTLSEENGKNNIQPFLQDFSSKLNIDINILLPLQQGNRWEKFVTTLIAIVPRADGSGRYDQ